MHLVSPPGRTKEEDVEGRESREHPSVSLILRERDRDRDRQKGKLRILQPK